MEVVGPEGSLKKGKRSNFALIRREEACKVRKMERVVDTLLLVVK